MFTKKESGFTLIELMIVVAIIGILAAVAIPKFADLIDKAKEAASKGKLGAMRSAISIYYGSYEGLAPSPTAGLASGDPATLKTALVDDGDSMSELPAMEVPVLRATVGGSSTGKIEIEANDPAIFHTYSSKGTTEVTDTNSALAYDSDAVELWVETKMLDTADSAIHKW